jgi:cytoskeletal protein CcmA (bactofilin family)
MNKKINGLTTIIGNGTTVVGDLQVEGGLRVEGIIKGAVNASGELVVTNSGIIEGEINVGSAIIAGKIKGNLTSKNKTVLEPNSTLYGDLKTKNLVITEGAILHGNCSMEDLSNQKASL